LYALFSVIEQICSTISDDDVARSKLGWWRNELEPNNLAASQHPLARELRETGTAERLLREPLDRLFSGAAQRITAKPPADLAALNRLCVETGQPRVELELGLTASSGSSGDVNVGQSARIGLMQLVSESAQGKDRGAYWWVPLNLLARHNVNREQIVSHSESKPVRNLFSDLFAEAQSWDERPGAGGTANSPARHLSVITALMSRKLARLAALGPDRFAGELGRVGPADLFHAWNAARRAG
jgi:phytoene/squalene synthetase